MGRAPVRHGAGDKLGHFTIERHLGSGAMSEVYLALDEKLDIKVALKIISHNLVSSPVQVERFKREARAAARLNHPNIARVFFFSADDGAPYYSLEWVRGRSVADIIEWRVGFTLGQFLSLARQTVEGLAAAQATGIIHRDIKPGNLMVGLEGDLKIVDFGLAKLTDNNSLTSSGTMLGTPYYISPEAIRGEGELDHRTDIYSFGVTFFHLLTGQLPYDADTPYAVMMKHLSAPVPDARRMNPGYPGELTRIIERCMAKEPRRRYPDYGSLLEELVEAELALSERLAEQLGFCNQDKFNTFHPNDRCNVCDAPASPRRKPEFFNLKITAWRESDSIYKSSRYIAKAVGRKRGPIVKMLEQLPFKVGHRLSYEKAKRMQRTFYELGADVVLEPIAEDVEGRETLEFKPRPVSSAGRKRPSRARRRLSRMEWLSIGLGALSAGLLAALVFQTQRLSRQAPHAPAPPPAAVTVTLPDDLEWVEWSAEEQLLWQVRSSFDSAMTVLQERYTLPLPHPLQVTLDHQRPAQVAGDARAWEAAPLVPVLQIPARGLEPGTPLDCMARNLATRASLRALAGPEAPAWLVVGLAAVEERELCPAESGSSMVPAWRQQVLTESGSLARNEAEFVDRSIAFVQHLEGWQGREALFVFAAELGSADPDTAAIRVWGRSLGELVAAWR